LEKGLTLSILPDRFAVCRLDSNYPIPLWVLKSKEFFSITRTDEELSIVCFEDSVPYDVKAEKGWRAFKVEGPLDFSLSGILSSLINPLARKEISIFAISTYDTDYILVKEEQLAEAKDVLGIQFEIVS